MLPEFNTGRFILGQKWDGGDFWGIDSYFRLRDGNDSIINTRSAQFEIMLT